jgi:hypothetical protein
MGMRSKLQKLRTAIFGESGSATVEFVILFPFFFSLFLSSFELSLYLVRDVMLEHAVDLNVRLLRLGALEPATQEELQKRICDDALIFSDCPNSILVELTPVSTSTWNLPASDVACVKRDEEVQPEVGFDVGNQNNLMVVRACAVADPFFPTTAGMLEMPRDESGGYRLVAISTFVNEP